MLPAILVLYPYKGSASRNSTSPRSKSVFCGHGGRHSIYTVFDFSADERQFEYESFRCYPCVVVARLLMYFCHLCRLVCAA